MPEPTASEVAPVVVPTPVPMAPVKPQVLHGDHKFMIISTLVIFALSAIALVVASLMNQPTVNTAKDTLPMVANPQASTVPPVAPDSVTSENGVIHFRSEALGIEFDVAEDQGGMEAAQVTILREGDKVYVGVGGGDIRSNGQYVEVFTKELDTQLKAAIEQKFLVGYNPSECFVNEPQDSQSKVDPADHITATIGFPVAEGDGLPEISAKGAKCPRPYTAVGGIAYFMGSSIPINRFLFFSIGQYAIVAPGDDGEGNPIGWQQTLKFL